MVFRLHNIVWSEAFILAATQPRAGVLLFAGGTCWEDNLYNANDGNRAQQTPDPLSHPQKSTPINTATAFMFAIVPVIHGPHHNAGVVYGSRSKDGPIYGSMSRRFAGF
jgi:hypothetical protein